MSHAIQSLIDTGFTNRKTNKKLIKLAICIMMDLIGSGGLGFPLLGDLLDVFTAPIYAIMLHALFASNAVTVAGLTEELLPGTDGIPSATLAWVAEQRGYINNFNNNNSSDDLRVPTTTASSSLEDDK